MIEGENVKRHAILEFAKKNASFGFIKNYEGIILCLVEIIFAY